MCRTELRDEVEFRDGVVMYREFNVYSVYSVARCQGLVGGLSPLVAGLVKGTGVTAEFAAGLVGELDLLGGGRRGALHGEERGLRGRRCQDGPGVDDRLRLRPWASRSCARRRRRLLLGEVVGGGEVEVVG